MASKAVEDAITDHLQANWTRCPIMVENTQGDAPNDGSPFIVLQFPMSITVRRTISDRVYWEAGGFRIIINVASGEGTDTIREWGAELAVMFRDQQIGPVNCRTPTEPFTDMGADRGNYWQGSMVVTYDYAFFG